jgi:hypothetical protein
MSEHPGVGVVVLVGALDPSDARGVRRVTRIEFHDIVARRHLTGSIEEIVRDPLDFGYLVCGEDPADDEITVLAIRANLLVAERRGG